MKEKFLKITISAIVLMVLLSITLVNAQPPSFPEAEGYGRFSIGGRGGKIIEVTNLNDAGTGSFGAALKASGLRIVVFRLAGIIEIASDITISNP